MLNYSSRLKKHIKRENLEASGAREERVELNKREPDEGDLFGIRAIQSGYYGGVAQSRPNSSHGSIEGSSSNTLLGSHGSPKLAASPSSSVTILPLDSRKSSPLAHKSISAEDLGMPTTPKRNAPTPLRTTLQPSVAELSGRVNHDPAVNMLLEVPPSPAATSRPPTTYMDNNDRRPPSSYFPAQHNGGQHAPLGAPQDSPPANLKRSSTRPVSAAESRQNSTQGHHSQSASIISGTTDASTQDGQRSPTQVEEPLIRIPAPIAREERPRSRGREERPRSFLQPLPPRSSSLGREHPDSPMIRPQKDTAPAILQPPRAMSAVGDWGSAIFHEIDESLQDSKSLAVSPPTEKYSHHTSTLSDASSTYSIVPVGQRISNKEISPMAMSQGPEIITATNTHGDTAPQVEDTTATQVGTRRPSDASSYRPTSSNGSITGSHRNTRELSEFYDSYWRRSQQGQSNHQVVPNGRLGDPGREGRRVIMGQTEQMPETIIEVPSPVPSPMIGKAL
ncbi:MAG: hypothetical protein LQ342_000197 [Letrouitia transgressa]|nr:MAG: hypothetical protein LQ342_000197 [Letrouitia transgressa]